MDRGGLVSRDAETLYQEIKPLVGEADASLALVDVAWLPSRGAARLQVLIARRNGGISLDDCQRVTERLNEFLDHYDPHSGAYVLEVSSPGLDRVLRRRDEYDIFAGREVLLTVVQPDGHTAQLEGRLLQIEGDRVHVDHGSEVRQIPFEAIKKAKLSFKFK